MQVAGDELLAVPDMPAMLPPAIAVAVQLHFIATEPAPNTRLRYCYKDSFALG